MESASFHTQHHQFQQQLNGYSSLATLQPGHGVSTVNDWNPTSLILACRKDINYNEYDNTIIHYSTEEDYLWPKNSTTVHQTRSFTHQPGSNNELSFAKEKEMSDFPKFSSALVHNPTSNVEKMDLPYSSNYNFKRDEPYCHDHLGVLEESLSLIDFFSRPQVTDDHQRLGGELYATSTQGISECFSVQSLPSSSRFDHLNNIAFINTNMSDMKNLSSSSSSLLSSSLGLKLKADSDLFNLTYYSGGSQCHGQSTADNQVPESSNSSSNSSNKRSALLRGIERIKPSSSKPKASDAAAKKKPRLGSESPCSLTKVEKQKERERIAALQGLVAPFGKTDKASVLTEVIGYIQFLQDQIQTLSLPNNKSSGKKPYRGMLTGSNTEVRSSEDEKLKPDLRSRGLCLMPISCTSSITSSSGGSIMSTSPSNHTIPWSSHPWVSRA